ncbi:uncharacterized protein METZ01_LOCUS483877, partial [marine metagenome]
YCFNCNHRRISRTCDVAAKYCSRYASNIRL